jgi:hypothetical protein
LLKLAVFAFVIVNVPVDDVIVRPLIEVAVAAPIVGVVSVGEVASTKFPVPVTVQFAVVGTADPPELLHSAALFAIATRPMVPLVVMVPPVSPLLVATLVTVPEPDDGVAQVPSPRQNVVEDALVPPFRLLTDKLPVTPVDSGSPVALVRTNAVGVPSAGVTNVGEVAITALPVPVTVQFAVVGTADPPELLHSIALLAMEASPILPLEVTVPVSPLLPDTLVTVPVPLTV